MDLIQFQATISGFEQRDGKLYIEWYASTPEIDRYNSIITKESFDSWIKNYLKNPVILLGHNPDKAIGVMVEHKMDTKWLWIKAEISKNEDNIYSDITEWRTKWFSIGFVPMKSEYKTRDGRKLSDITEEEYRLLDDKDVVRVISEIELVEISVVNVPANPSSLFSLTKAVRAYFDKMETRSVMDMQRRILISNDNNPFIDTPKQEEIAIEETQEEQEETTEEVTEQNESEAIGDTTPEKVEETQEITTDETQEEGEEVAEVSTTDEAPQEPAQEAQTADHEVVKALEEERKLNQELLEQLEKATNLVQNLQSKLDTRAVNKPVLYSQNQVKDQFAEQLVKAKYGQ